MDLPDDLAALDPDPDLRRRWTKMAVDHVLAAQDAADEERAIGLGLFAPPTAEPQPPEDPTDMASLLSGHFDHRLRDAYTPTSPRCFAYVPGGGLYASALADLISDATNRFTGIRATAPALVQLEADVIRWFCHWLALPSTAVGTLTTGGSTAHLTAIFAAREDKLGRNAHRGTIYVSDQAHHSIVKAARVVGFFEDQIRTVATDASARMDVRDLVQKIESDRATGLDPFFVMSTFGTTNNGVIDPIADIAAVAQEHGLWHHVDGAYGGFFLMLEATGRAHRAVRDADSITLDPHKGLFLPYGTGAVLLNRPKSIKKAFGTWAPYLPGKDRAEDCYDPSELSWELSRDFRGFRVWLPIKLYGARRFRAALADKCQVARYAADQIASIDGLELLNRPELSLFAFRVVSGSGRVQDDAATRYLVEEIGRRRRCVISGSDLKGRYAARVCVLVFRTRQHHVDDLIDEIKAVLPQALESAASASMCDRI